MGLGRRQPYASPAAQTPVVQQVEPFTRRKAVESDRASTTHGRELDRYLDVGRITGILLKWSQVHTNRNSRNFPTSSLPYLSVHLKDEIFEVHPRALSPSYRCREKGGNCVIPATSGEYPVTKKVQNWTTLVKCQPQLEENRFRVG